MFFALIAAAAVALSASFAAEGPRRVALVVGVSHYQHAGTLDNPANDAKSMESMLGRLGFDVETVIDPTRVDLESAIRRLGRRSVGADVALFHYSGHALEVGGRNWILPATFNASFEREMPFEAIDLQMVLDQTSNSARVSLVFLDACRNNPFAPRLASSHRGVASQGLAQIATPAGGALIAFATAPGEVAADGSGVNSPFTTALLHRLETPGVEIKTLMGRVIEDVANATDDQQRPWMTFTLKGDFYLRPPAENPSAPMPAGPKGSPDAELLFWQSIMSSKLAADYAAYLEKFPSGVFASLAKTRIADLTALAPGQTPSTAATPGSSLAISLDKDGLATQFAARNADFKHAARDAEYYVSRPDHRAIAASEDAYFMRTARPSLRDAEDLALEGCQIWTKKACSLLSKEARWTSSDERTPRAMPRVSYEGLFDPAMIPIVDDSVRNRADVTGYRAATAPKAAALLPSLGIFVVARAGSQRSAEESALSQCNTDPTRNDMSGPCFLYAVGDQVILARGLTQAIAAR